MDTEAIRLERQGGVARLLIDRVEKKNALDMAMWQAIPSLLAQATDEPAIRVLVVTSAAPGVFSAGADISEFKAIAADPVLQRRNLSAVRAAQNAVAEFPLPTIAAIEGACVGGGCALALACDMRIAVANARFGITPARLGLIYPLEDMVRLVDAVGLPAARRLVYTAGLIDAAEAQRIGLVDQVVPADDLASVIDGLAGEIAQRAPGSLRQMKRHFRLIADGQRADNEATLQAFLDAYTTDDFAEGTAAFLEGRSPRFRS